MNKNVPKLMLSLLLLISFFTVSLPTAGYAQASAAKGRTQAETIFDTSYASSLQTIEEKTEARRKELGIPGMSLVIVKDGKIIFMKPFGYKDFENKMPVTSDTQFAIGSATKAFTALTVLMAQDEGKLSLDDSPKKYLPYFKMFDPETDKNITIRDLLSHSSGLNRTDLAMLTGKLNRAELIQVAGEAKPTAKLREKFQYQNIMFVAGGEIAATVEKTPWGKLVSERILKPLGMTNSTVSIDQMEKAKDHSFGYNYNFDTKETQKLPFRAIDEVAPAGAINSTARDMAKWLQFVLDGGAVNGKRLVSENGYAEWLKPQMKIGGSSSYGLGWFLQDWNGLKVVQHGGNIDGFNSMVAMIPEKKIGFAMLTNVSGSSLGNELMPIVWQNLLGDKKIDNSAKLPREAMEKLAGKYHLTSANVDIEVKIENDDLILIVPGRGQYKLEMTGSRQFKPVGAPDGFGVKFSPAEGSATEMQLQQPNRSDTLPRMGSVTANATTTDDPAKELIGKYTSEANGVMIEVKDVDGKTSFVIGGQPPYALGEKEKDTFSMSPLPDAYFLKVKRDAAGKIEKIIVTQPEGEFGFKPVSGDNKIALTADELMQKVIDAAGGDANLRKINTRVVTFDLDFENQGVKGSGTSYAKAPNKTATETVMTALGKKIASGYEYFDGTGGEEIYTFAPADKYTGKQLEDVRLGADFYSLLDWKTNYKKVEIVSMGKVGGEDAYVVSFEPEKGSKFTEYYSAKTFLLLKRDGTIASSTSNVSLPYTIVYGDYRDVDGIKMPFKTTNYSISNGNIVTQLKEVKNNVPIADSVFSAKKVE